MIWWPGGSAVGQAWNGPTVTQVPSVQGALKAGQTVHVAGHSLTYLSSRVDDSLKTHHHDDIHAFQQLLATAVAQGKTQPQAP